MTQDKDNHRETNQDFTPAKVMPKYKPNQLYEPDSRSVLGLNPWLPSAPDCRHEMFGNKFNDNADELIQDFSKGCWVKSNKEQLP